MPSATASGADASNPNSSGSSSSQQPRNREHNQGNQERKYTAQQQEAVLRIRRCQPTAFYDILELEAVRKSCSDADIKKAYRKQSLLTHPDKNGHEHADEAFKMVSRAFSVLGDKDKRDRFDRFGTDPDSRFASAQAQNPFAGFARRAASGGGGPGGGGGGGGWDDEISPEEMFQRFFGGGGGGGFGPFGGGFDTGPQFVFNFGGGPGIRVHQFGGPRPRRRPREDGNGGQEAQDSSVLGTLMGLLPILLLFIFPLLNALFSGGDASPALPPMSFDRASPPLTHQRTTPNHGVHYFVDPQDVAGLSPHRLKTLDRNAELAFVRAMQVECEREQTRRQVEMREAAGWGFFPDQQRMAAARNMNLPSCKRLDEMGART